jgi:hypothetical protein
MFPQPRLLAALAAVYLATEAAPAQAWLDRAANALSYESPHGGFRSDLSGLLDLEGYYIDQRPPGLLLGDDQDFFNPMLSLFLDTRLGTHVYSFVQARFDRGFDPRARRRDARLDEYLLRYTPFDDARLNVQVGKFATVIGNWVPREDSWNNPLINAPLPYENITIVGDQTAPGSPAQFLARLNQPDRKSVWLPMIWGPVYAAGGSVFGRLQKLEYAVEVKNAAPSSRPYFWDPTEVGWDHPTVSGRVGLRPAAPWDVGASFSYGAYLQPEAVGTLPAGAGIGDFHQITLGQDLRYARHHWQLWAEAYETRFQVPAVGNADTLAYYLETKYKLTAHWFVAGRWNQQFFGQVNDGLGGEQRWGQDTWRVDAALGCRFNLHLQAKLQYSFNRRTGPIQQGEQLVAAQVTVKF